MEQDSIRQYYDRWYSHEGRRELADGLARARSNLSRMRLRAGDRVVDIGCGRGAMGACLASLGARAYGLDISHGAALASNKLGCYAAALQANAERLPWADRSFDAAALMGTLEHFFDPVQALCEVVRVLKPGAQVCLLVPNSEFALFRFLGGTGQPHEVPRTYEGWTALFEASGLRIETVYRDRGPGVFVGGLARGLVRKIVLLLSGLFPIRFTYQFVFVCTTNPPVLI